MMYKIIIYMIYVVVIVYVRNLMYVIYIYIYITSAGFGMEPSTSGLALRVAPEPPSLSRCSRGSP